MSKFTLNLAGICTTLRNQTTMPLATNGVRASVGGEDGLPLRAMRLDVLAGATGVDAWQLETALGKYVDTMESIGQPAQVTIAPYRSRVAYGLPDGIEAAERGERPAESKVRARVAKSDKAPAKTFWPYVILGTVLPMLGSSAESTYDGRHDSIADEIRNLLVAAGIDYIDVRGRMVRGGSGIYIALESDKSE